VYRRAPPRAARARIGPGDEVVTTRYLAATRTASSWSARAGVADVDPGTLQLTPRSAEAALTPRRARSCRSLAGQACDLDGFAALARQHGLVVIEDAAHAAGHEYRGRRSAPGANTPASASIPRRT